ncbi:MAG: hypothetical protein IAE78_29610 [Myxococcus sp.]|nr:hypothetical protein [Myxococcus sp.]
MATERVDKGWQQRGIDCYPVEAIIGTLAHYGVKIDEASFKAAAAEHFPLAIAMKWHEGWKGTGQFSRFPAAAAEELWRRLLPGQIAPTDVALAVINLMKDLADLLDEKKDQGTLETRFKVVEAYLPSIPPPPRRDLFIGELIGALNDWMEPLDGMGEALAKKKHDALADRFVAIEEALISQRKGVASAIVQAQRGDRDGAVRAFSAIALDSQRDFWNRLSALDALLDFEENELAKQAALPLFDDAEKSKDLELVSSVIERLAHLLEVDPAMPERKALRERIERLAAELGPGDEDEDA